VWAADAILAAWRSGVRHKIRLANYAIGAVEGKKRLDGRELLSFNPRLLEGVQLDLRLLGTPRYGVVTKGRFSGFAPQGLCRATSRAQKSAFSLLVSLEMGTQVCGHYPGYGPPSI
jgi:hypothetical protein